MRSFLLCSLLILSAYNSGAQAVGTWTQTGPIPFPTNINKTGDINGIGRVSQLKFSRNDPRKMYAVSASGGLYISYNNGYTWAVTPGTDKMATTQCSSVCEDYTDENIIYLSTGDANLFHDNFGIWKSTDGGNTFTAANTGIGNAMASEILMHPTTHTILVAAATNGVWKTTNSATSWTQKQTGDFKDMKANPKNNNTLFAVTATDFYKSTDFGETWTSTPITTPSGNKSLRIAVTAADTNIVYLVTTHGNGQILKSTNGGASFTTVYSSSTQCLVCVDESPASGSQLQYNIDITANPVNANEVLVAAHCVWRSTDGGLTWRKRTNYWYVCHTDMHWIEFNPYNPRQVFNANDGGVFMSTDTTKAQWSPRSDGLAATEIAHAAQSPVDRQVISIGTQDNGNLYFNEQWKTLYGGDWYDRRTFDYRPGSNVWHYEVNFSFRQALKPLDTGSKFNTPLPPGVMGKDMAFIRNSNTAFYAYDTTIWRSNNINDAVPTWQKIFSIPSATSFSTKLYHIESCAADSNILYVYSDWNYGTVYRSKNALATSPGFTELPKPAFGWRLGTITTSRQNAGYVYMSCNNQIFVSKDTGNTWTEITGGLPGNDILGIIHDDYSPKERIFVSTGTNVYYKDSTTTSWTPCIGLPSVAKFTDLMIYNDGTAASVLRVSTYGRGVWEVGINNDHTPIIDFTADKKQVCPNDAVHFTASGYGTLTSYNWSFPGGTPATSSSSNPTVHYSTPGVYTITLIAGNAAGNDTAVRTAYINVTNGAVASFTEGFEDTTIFPPLYWHSVSNSGLVWQRDTVGGFGTSAHSIVFDNFSNDAGPAHNRMITPSADLDTTKNAYVTFDVAYSFMPGHRDSLVVKASDNCGQTWTTIYAKDSTALATTISMNGRFTPTSSQWRKDTISLLSYLNKTVMLSFENVGHFGNAIYLDNINVNFTKNVGVNTVANTADIEVYPNPTTGVVFIKGSGIDGNKLTIECYNIVGELVNRKEWTVNNGKFSTNIDLSHFPKGVYELKFHTDDGNSIMKKIVLR